MFRMLMGCRGKGGDDDGDVNDGPQKRHFECRYTIFKPLFTGQTYDDEMGQPHGGLDGEGDGDVVDDDED